MEISKKRQNEINIVTQMVLLYCRKNPDDIEISSNCNEIINYISTRIDNCPHMEYKTFCSNCKTPCYNSYYRPIIKKIMRFSGPRMLFHKPILTIKHGFKFELKLLNKIYVFLGFLFASIGIAAIGIPLIPTTPFLLLASYFLMKGSTKYHNYFKSTKVYKKYLEDYENTKSMTLQNKIKILAFATSMIMIPFFKTDKVSVKLIILLVCVFKYYYFFAVIKTEERR